MNIHKHIFNKLKSNITKVEVIKLFGTFSSNPISENFGNIEFNANPTSYEDSISRLEEKLKVLKKKESFLNTLIIGGVVFTFLFTVFIILYSMFLEPDSAKISIYLKLAPAALTGILSLLLKRSETKLSNEIVPLQKDINFLIKWDHMISSISGLEEPTLKLKVLEKLIVNDNS